MSKEFQQKLYDHITSFLLVQNRRSSFRGGNVLVDKKGRCCAYGSLLPEKSRSRLVECADPAISYGGVPTAFGEELVKEWGEEVASADSQAVMNRLMDVHDNYPPSRWRKLFRKVALHLELRPCPE